MLRAPLCAWLRTDRVTGSRRAGSRVQEGLATVTGCKVRRRDVSQGIGGGADVRSAQR